MIEIKNLNLNVGDFKLKNINLSINNGEFYVLLGPSGSGKTLLIDAISGFIKSENNGIYIDGINIDKFLIEDRNLSVCYQEFNLFPHMTVEKNIKYGFKYRKNYDENFFYEIIDILNISHLLNKYPNVLSGGEKQRVSLARSLVIKPKILLLDEPLSALDSNIKETLIRDIKRIHKRFNITVLMITHNFEEAFYLADKISVINNGEIKQSGTLNEIFNFPNNKFIANFVGMKNIFKASLIKISNFGYIGIRSENVKISYNVLNLDYNYQGKIVEITMLKSYIEIIVFTDIKNIVIYISLSEFLNKNYKINDIVYVAFNAGDISVLDEYDDEI